MLNIFLPMGLSGKGNDGTIVMFLILIGIYTNVNFIKTHGMVQLKSVQFTACKFYFKKKANCKLIVNSCSFYACRSS